MPLRDLTVGQLMTKSVISISAEQTVAEAHERMRALDIRHLPVIDESGGVVGILSDRDLLRAAGENPRAQTMRLLSVMTEDVITVRPETRACEATLLLLEHKIGSLPVVSDDRRLVGLITESDFVRLAHQLLGGEALSIEQ